MAKKTLSGIFDAGDGMVAVVTRSKGMSKTRWGKFRLPKDNRPSNPYTHKRLPFPAALCMHKKKRRKRRRDRE